MGETWPVSVMEAMGAGLPVISSIIGATPEMIRPGVDDSLSPSGTRTAYSMKSWFWLRIYRFANQLALLRDRPRPIGSTWQPALHRCVMR
jgi:glycosyltransferase involved in cell wall biosynthesis